MRGTRKRGKSGPPKVEDLKEVLAQAVEIPAGEDPGALPAADPRPPRKNAAIFSSASECWLTPPVVVDLLVALCGEDGVALDPCSHPLSLVPARERWFGPIKDPLGHAAPNDVDGLTRDWPLDGVTYVNPPYGRALVSRTVGWTQKIQAEADRGCEIIALVPARTDTAWWVQMHPTCWLAWEGRLIFLEPAEDWIAREGRRAAEKRRAPRPAPAEVYPGLVRGDSATFPSALLYFGHRRAAFAATFGPTGRLYQDLVPRWLSDLGRK